MRDAHRLKEKIELSLDTRDVAAIVVVSVVLVAGSFVLGVTVGKGMATGPTAPSDDVLTQLDRKAAAAKDATPEAYTFQRELVATVDRRKDDEAVAVAPAAPDAGGVKIETPVVVPTAPDPDPKDRLKEALAEAARKPAKTAAPAAELGRWAVQVGAYQDRGEAQKVSETLSGKGYAPYLVAVPVKGKGTWYRVRLGNFPEREQAERYLSDFRREVPGTGFVAKNE